MRAGSSLYMDNACSTYCAENSFNAIRCNIENKIIWRSLNYRTVFLPYAAPSTGAFERTNRQDCRFACAAPEGRGTWMYRVSSPLGAPQGCGALHAGAGKPLHATPFKSEERRIKAVSGWPFLWILYFGQAKESISAVGPRPDF
jgi:hypothetical protein